MKKLLASISLFAILTGSALAQIPQELKDLIPAGRSDVRLEGKTQDNRNCMADIAIGSLGFHAEVYALSNQGTLDSRRFAKFQIGLGHKLQSLKIVDGNLVAISAHSKEDEYSSDTRSTFKINITKNKAKAIQIVNERKALFGYKKEANETCFF